MKDLKKLNVFFKENKVDAALFAALCMESVIAGAIGCYTAIMQMWLEFSFNTISALAAAVFVISHVSKDYNNFN